MATVTFKGTPVHTVGQLPSVGSTAPAFKLAGGDLVDVGLEKFGHQKKILNIAHSLDTGTCQKSAVQFNQEAGKLGDTVIVTITMDLPFAQKRFCDAEKLGHITVLSAFRSPAFGKDYGVTYIDSPLAGLLSRAIVVLDSHNKVVYTEHVAESSSEPNYAEALKALASAH